MRDAIVDRLAVMVAALWWGSLSVVGFVLVPLLFAHLPTRALAGNMGGVFFATQTWISLVCGFLLLLSVRGRDSLELTTQTRKIFAGTVGGMLLALLSEFAVAPRILTRENLPLWHGVGTTLYIFQWLCAAFVLWTLTKASLAHSRQC